MPVSTTCADRGRRDGPAASEISTNWTPVARNLLRNVQNARAGPAQLPLDAATHKPYMFAQDNVASTDHPLYDQIVEACRSVYDPEIPVNIYDLGLIYTIDIDAENAVKVIMTLTAPGCPVAGEMPGWVAEAIEPLAGVKQVDVELTWEPPWGMDMMSDEARLELGFM